MHKEEMMTHRRPLFFSAFHQPQTLHAFPSGLPPRFWGSLWRNIALQAQMTGSDMVEFWACVRAFSRAADPQDIPVQVIHSSVPSNILWRMTNALTFQR